MNQPQPAMTAETAQGLKFYRDTIEKLIARGVFSRHASTLVLGAGRNDRDALAALGFDNVIFSNVAPEVTADLFAPFAFERHDAECIERPDNSVDQVIIANALHHCRFPHRALLEMLRVAAHGALAFENRDSLLMRLATRFKFSQEYEWDSVANWGGDAGGLNFTDIPNYIYRWTEREVHKTVASYEPAVKPRIHYFYGLRSPAQRLTRMKLGGKAAVAGAAHLALRGVTAVFPSQSNLFAFCVEKSKETWPWIEATEDGYQFKTGWERRRGKG